MWFKAPFLNSFKSRLDRHWSDQPSKFELSCYVPHATGQSVSGGKGGTNVPEEAGIA